MNNRHNNNRGSVLLLVIGLLTMLAMIGGTFLIVSRLNTKQVKDMALRNATDPVANGVVTSISQALAKDLWFGGTVSYTASSNSWTWWLGGNGVALTSAQIFGPGPFGYYQEPSTITDTDANVQIAKRAQAVDANWKRFIDYPENGQDSYLRWNEPAIPVRPYWSSNVEYRQADVVRHGNFTYYAVKDSSGKQPDATTCNPEDAANFYWVVYSYPAPPVILQARPVWDAYAPLNVYTQNGAYLPDTVVLHNGVYYYALRPSDTTNRKVPGTDINFWQTCPVTDTDGDGMMDSYLVPSGVANASGDKYFVSARVIDTCGKMNVNTAYQANLAMTEPGPSSVNLEMLAESPNYTNIVNKRVSAGSADYNKEAALRLLWPEGSNRPFGPADEACLNSYNKASSLRVGYLSEAIQNILNDLDSTDSNARSVALQKLRHMTTWSVSRPLMRHPEMGQAAVQLRKLALNESNGTAVGANATDDGPAGDLNANRNKLYYQVKQMLAMFISDSDEQKKCATSFVANLWAMQDTTPAENGDPWEFPCPEQLGTPAAPEVFTAYGLGRPTVFISEVYAKRVVDPVDGTVKDVQAIEVINYSTSTVSFSAAGTTANGKNTRYFIQVGSNAPKQLVKPLPPPVTLSANGGRFFFVTYSGGGDASLITGATGSPILVDGIDFTKTIVLYKEVTDTVTGKVYRVALDQLDVKTWIEDGTGYGDTTKSQQINFRRNDTKTDWRFAIANAWKVYGPSDAAAADGHMLGKGNAIAMNDAEIAANAKYPVILQDPVVAPDVKPLPQSIVALAGGDYKQTAPSVFLYRIGTYFCSSSKTEKSGGTTLTPFTQRLCETSFAAAFPADDPIRGRLNLRGRVNQAGWTFNSKANYFPDVPVGCFIDEFFQIVPADPTRADQSLATADNRHYGKINVNTASADLLKCLPWPEYAVFRMEKLAFYKLTSGLRDLAIEYILAYRDRRQVDDDIIRGAVALSDVPKFQKNYSRRNSGTGIANLRESSHFPGFLTPAEVSIPLSDFMLNFAICFSLQTTMPSGVMTVTDEETFKQQPTYAADRDNLYRSISNLLTVRSDSFVAHMVVELRDPTGLKTRQTWRYIALFDRSNCRKPGDKPAILLFTEGR